MTAEVKEEEEEGKGCGAGSSSSGGDLTPAGAMPVLVVCPQLPRHLPRGGVLRAPRAEMALAMTDL
jgi:hypothetical protein